MNVTVERIAALLFALLLGVICGFGCAREYSGEPGDADLAGFVARVQDGRIPIEEVRIGLAWREPKQYPKDRRTLTTHGLRGSSVFLVPVEGPSLSAAGTRRLTLTKAEVIDLLQAVRDASQEIVPTRKLNWDADSVRLDVGQEEATANGGARITWRLSAHLYCPPASNGKRVLDMANKIATSTEFLPPDEEVKFLQYSIQSAGMEITAWRMLEIKTPASTGILKIWNANHNWGTFEKDNPPSLNTAIRKEIAARESGSK